MPNYDAGHYFLTALAPVRLDSVLIDGQSHSRRHLIREALAAIPAAENTVASQGTNPDNPFARTTRTHFARFVVLDDVVFNGRVSGDSLIGLVRGIDPLNPQKVDRLSTPFLIFVADFDAESGADTALKDYLAALWATMPSELNAIFQHCMGFDSVRNGDDFIRYIKKCQIETTMPFNDYWSAPPGLSDLDLAPYKYAALGLAALALIGIVWCKARLGLAALVALIVLALFAYRAVVNKASVPLPKSPPPAPSSDLPTVLKALYVQRAFTDFSIKMQGEGNQALYDAFGAFITEHKPDDVAAPTQAPGIIGLSEASMAP